MPSRSPRWYPYALMVRVSRLIFSTRVGSSANASAVIGSPLSAASLNATCPLIPRPPKQASAPPRSRDHLVVFRFGARLRKMPLGLGHHQVRGHAVVEFTLHAAVEAHEIVVGYSPVGRYQVFVHIEKMHIVQRHLHPVDQLRQNRVLLHRADGNDHYGLLVFSRYAA